jgi:hypothetical protein
VFWVELEGNQIFALVLVEEIPANSPLYFSVTDFTACDAVGVGESLQTTGVLPSLLTN